MFLFILDTEEQFFDSITLYLFIGLITVAFFFNMFKSRYSKKTLWIIGSIIMAIGIFLSIYRIKDVSILFGVVVIFFGITIIPLRDIFAKIKPKTSESNSDLSKKAREEDKFNYTQTKSKEYILKGLDFKNKQKYQKAIDSFVRALKVNPNSAESWFELGQINFVRERIPEALTCYERAVDINPAYHEALKRYKEVEQILKDSGNEQDQK